MNTNTWITAVNYTDHDESSSFYNPNYTYSNDKYSCVREFYFLHMMCAYLVFLTGLGCMVTRIISPRYRWMHSWFGRGYILSMLWCTLTSLLIHNTGLPLSTIVSFVAIMICLSVGWILIIVYRNNMDKAATELVSKRLIAELTSPNNNNCFINKPSLSSTSTSAAAARGQQEDSTTAPNDATRGLQERIAEAKLEIATQKSFVERFFSFKTLHGVLYFVSWFQIAGRIFSSNQSGDFTCHTYPVFKPIETKHGNFAASSAPLTIVPESDPNYDNLPWAALGPVKWTMLILFGSMIAAMAIGAVWNFINVHNDDIRQTILCQHQEEQQRDHDDSSLDVEGNITSGSSAIHNKNDSTQRRQGPVVSSSHHDSTTSEQGCDDHDSDLVDIVMLEDGNE